MLIAGADAGSVEAAMKRIAAGNSDLAASKVLQIADRSVPAAEEAFTYVDPALIYTRIDATFRPVLLMGAAFLPAISETIELNKLPTPEAITKHLSPIVMSQRYDGDGHISQSVGPVTVYQTVVGAGGLGAAAASSIRTPDPGPTLLPPATSSPASPASPINATLAKSGRIARVI